MLSVLMVLLAGGAGASPIAEAAVRGTDLCVQMQSGQLNLRGDDQSQSKNMVLASEEGPGGVFLGLSPNGCDVLIGSDGEASLKAVRDWVQAEDGLGWRQVPSLGALGQGERGDGAHYFVSNDYSMSLAIAKSVNDMGRVVVLPPIPAPLLKLRVDTATHGSQRDAGRAVLDAVTDVCPLMGDELDALTPEKRAVLMAQLRTFSGGAGEVAHADEARDTVIARADTWGCQVAVRALANTRIASLEDEVPHLLEEHGWRLQGEGDWQSAEGASLQIHSGPGIMLVEVKTAR